MLLLYRERGWTATFDADDLVSYADEGISGEEIMRDCALWMADASQNNEVVLGQLRTRNLPIPAAVFAERLVRALEGMREPRAIAAAR